MEITPDNWLSPVTRFPLSGGLPMLTRRFLVIHFTSGASAKSSIDFWKTPAAKGACAHLVIDRNGDIFQCRPFDRTCGHAGASRWNGYEGLNACAIGIELANAGDDAALARRWSQLAPLHTRHKHGGPVCDWEAFPTAQVAACTEVAKLLVARYRLDDVVGHDDIAPGRKNDPGPAFPMWSLREACGFPAEIG